VSCERIGGDCLLARSTGSIQLPPANGLSDSPRFIGCDLDGTLLPWANFLQHQNRALRMISYRMGLVVLFLGLPTASLAEQACDDCNNICAAQYTTCVQSACWAGGGVLGPMSVCNAPSAPTGVTPDYQKQIQQCSAVQRFCSTKCQPPACK
jgi:hypothetical protein